MTTQHILDELESRMHAELYGSILPFWSEKAVDNKYGGFLGRITHTGEIIGDAPKSAVLNTRILWTFSAVHRHDPETDVLGLADRAFRYLDTFFIDGEHGGLYWMVGYDGVPLDTRKHSYATAFAIYAFSEYYRATGNRRALTLAKDLFRLLEEYAFEHETGSYYEAFDQQWNRLEDVRLSTLDRKEHYSMNTQLHLLEALTALYTVWPEKLVKRRLYGLVRLFLDRICDSRYHHFHTFFDDNWKPVKMPYSYGHDIEAVWLLSEAAIVLGDQELIDKTSVVTRDVARILLHEGYDEVMGGIYSSGLNGSVSDTDKQWWAQAEAIVGFLEAYRITGHSEFVEKAMETWQFIESLFIDKVVGEWHYMVNAGGEPYRDEDKLGVWKCPYHTARACLQAIERIGNLRITEQKTGVITR